jgi:hypothetical protein
VPTLTWGCHGKSCCKIRQRGCGIKVLPGCACIPKLTASWNFVDAGFASGALVQVEQMWSATTWKETRLFVDGSTERESLPNKEEWQRVIP